MIYFIILFILLLLSLRYDYYRATKGRMFWYVATFVALVLVAGMRYRIGTDSIRYESYYKDMPVLWELSTNYFNKIRFEPGFVLLMSACRSVSEDFILFQFVHAIIINSAVFLLFWKNSRSPFTGIFFYCLFAYISMNTEVLRESLAVAVFIFAWPAFKNNKFLVYYLMILVAISFHLGATVCLFCPLFVLPGLGYFFTFGKRTFFICATILIIALIVNKMFFSYIKLLSFSATLVDRATAYSKNELGEATYNIMGILGNVVKWVIYPVLAMIFIRRDSALPRDAKSANERKHLEALVLMSIYIALTTIVINILHRFNSYFMLFAVLLLSRWIYTPITMYGKRYRLNFGYWWLILAPLLAVLVRGEMSDVGHSGRLKTYMTYYPYSSRLTMEEDRNREAVFRFYRSW